MEGKALSSVPYWFSYSIYPHDDFKSTIKAQAEEVSKDKLPFAPMCIK
jgi:hypothetical protein